MSKSRDQVTMHVVTHNEAETRALARTLAASLKRRDLVALEGDLGAGKTCFVRGLAEGLGLDPTQVSSPTFVIAHEYVGTNHTLAHIDAYRIRNADDLETIGWSEMQRDGDLIMAVEWPSRIVAALPAMRIDITMEASGESARNIRITAPGEMADRLRGLGSMSDDAVRAKQTRCRKCDRPIESQTPTFPFCSDRCRMADLGAWFSGGYSMTRPMASDDELE